MIEPPPLPSVCYAVFRYSANAWHRESRLFPQAAMAQRYAEGLPRDWRLEVREIPAEVAA